MSDHATFSSLKSHYDSNRFTDLIDGPDGIYWLKLRSIARKEHLVAVCQEVGIDCSNVNYRDLLPFLFDRRPPVEVIEDYISATYETERSMRRSNEDYLVSQLYQMRVFDWGGLFQNNLHRAIVDNYVKKIQDWDELNSAIDNELHFSLQGYVRCSWYNHWSSILIEDIFKDHAKVLPTIGLAKKVDFFINDFPFDLKVTYFPKEFMKLCRQAKGLRPEFTVLKQVCRECGIWFDSNKTERALFPELMAQVDEFPHRVAEDFLVDLRGIRSEIITETLQDPSELLVWLYEKQGEPRFDAASRFFLVLIDLNNLEESWKLKRNKNLLSPTIHAHLDNFEDVIVEDLKLRFNWNGSIFETYADILPIVVGG